MFILSLMESAAAAAAALCVCLCVFVKTHYNITNFETGRCCLLTQLNCK